MITPWTTQDAAMLRAFLETPTGQKMLSRLTRPAANGKITGFENVALQSRYADGFDSARLQILKDASYNKQEILDQSSRDLITLGTEEPR